MRKISKAREIRKEIFEDTKRLYESDESLVASINNSKKKQRVIAENEEVDTVAEQIYDTPAKIIVSSKRSLEAAKDYNGNRVCVLNFASATNPGGGVENGSSAQEEAICRCSTLFPCISDNDIREKFHDSHRSRIKNGEMTSLYNSDCIYTPEVTVFKSDTDNPELLPQEEWYKIDVISAAAPNLRNIPSNAMNPDSGEKVVVTKDEVLKLHIERARRILDIAVCNKVEIMIMGAFGCGAFRNSPEVVSEALASVIQDYLYKFKVIEFAVYCPPNDMTNYEVFNNRLSQM